MSDNHRRYRSIRTALSQMYASEPSNSQYEKGGTVGLVCGEKKWYSGEHDG